MNYYHNSTINISSQQNDIIIATLLGDGHLQKTLSKTETCRLRISHSLEQKYYVNYKHRKLLSLCQTTQAPKVNTKRAK